MGEAHAAQLSSREPHLQADWKGWGLAEQHPRGAEPTDGGRRWVGMRSDSARSSDVPYHNRGCSLFSCIWVSGEIGKRGASSGNSRCFMYNCRYQKVKKKPKPKSVSQGSVSPAPALGARQGLPHRLHSAVSAAEG